MEDHTPGPWVIHMTPKAPLMVRDSRGLEIARVARFPDRDANARLIAAAPALLAFARYVADTDPGNPAPFFARAREAVALAEAGSN